MINQERMARFGEKTRTEAKKELAFLRSRKDMLPEYGYFLELLEGGLSPEALTRRTGRPLISLLCIQAPLELIHAAGYLPFKLFSGSISAASLATAGLPALMCPMLRSLLGLFMLGQEPGTWILPTTCDWIVKFPEMLRLKNKQPRIHWVELPHLKETPRGEGLWQEEIFRMKAFLEAETKRKITRKALRDSILVYNRAWEALTLLEERRSAGRIPFPWFLAVTNAFFLDSPERWTAGVHALVKALAGDTEGAGKPGETGAARAEGAVRVFIAGSPIFFPGWKLPHLLEEAGLDVFCDDLCSSGRIFPGNVGLSDESVEGMTAALAERYHHGCLCPTFADNDRRVNNILALSGSGGQAVSAQRNYRGVIYHVLKGCHPCDIESYSLEGALKARGFRFLRLETDYTAEDSRNLLTRLEAFKQTLEG
jgi:benzoyl-CoA reductase/2-hydroxyglutaryl-CoA dehydratase subunit BcrC/BadD/HgdB